MSHAQHPLNIIDQIGPKLRARELRDAFTAWSGGRLGHRLPGLVDIEGVALSASPHMAVVEIEHGTHPLSFRFVQVGEHLARRAPGPLLGRRIGGASPDADMGDPLGSVAWAYRQCAISAKPSYEFADLDFGDGQPMLFERLLLPVGSGVVPSHVVVVSLFSESAEE